MVRPGKRAAAGVASLLLLLFVSATPARAQLKDQRHLVEIGLFLGIDFLASKHDLLNDRLDNHETFNKVAFEIGLRFGYLPIPWFGVEAEASVIPTKAGGETATAYTVRGHLIGQFPVYKGLAPFLVIGGGMLGLASKDSVLGKDVDAAFHWGVGLKYYINRWVAVRMDFRHIITDGLEDKAAHHFSLLLGASVVLNWKSDSDGDGIPDSKDRCPKTKGKAPSGCPDSDGDGFVDKDDKCPQVKGVAPAGCPADTDGDGVPDEKDACPKIKGPAPSGCPDTDGDGVIDKDDKCPKVPGVAPTGCPSDRDKDGIIDHKDKCPDTAGKAPTGCPDSDGDGVVDKDDKCPKVPGVAPTGCPPDSDGDGIPDNIDKCPKKPETKNGYQDADGCPDKIPRAVKRFSGTIKGIYFASGKAKIRRRSLPLLRRAAKVLKKYKSLRIKVRGHTDSRGKLDYNIRLSLRRAEAVKAYLVKRGVDETRIRVEGVGPKEPIASNKRRRGRAKNRRIEFKLIK